MRVYFNSKRTIPQYLWMAKRYLSLAFKYIPYRLTAYWRKEPDFLIIGVAKGGTTSLLDYINQHPDSQVSREKEVNYFTYHYNRSKFYYRSFFPLKKSNKITGEATPYYFVHPEAPSRIKQDLPKVKLILLLRDPVHRAYSQYNMVKNIDPAKSFEEAIKLENERMLEAITAFKRTKKMDASHQTFSYVFSGKYYEHLSNWLKYYKKEDILILKSEAFFENPKETLKRVYGYLGLSEIYPSDLSPKNQRKYAGLGKDNYIKYKGLFDEDGLQLKKLLGDYFTW